MLVYLNYAKNMLAQSRKAYWYRDGNTFIIWVDIEDITRLREDIDFMLEWQEQYLTSERSERVRYIVLATRT